MTRRWQCQKCGKTYRHHRSNIAAAHRCNPKIARVTVLELVDEGPTDDNKGTT